MPSGKYLFCFRTIMRKVSSAGGIPYVAFVLLFFQFFCDNSNTIPERQLLREWFVNTSNIHLPEILKIPPLKIDSIIRHSRIYGSVQAIKGSVQLTDTNRVLFTAGFQTPPFIHRDSSYPLVIYLHGGTGTQVNTKGEKAFEMLSALADSLPLFLASPSASRNAPWWTPAGMSRILQTLRFMTFSYPIDPSRVLLAGVSDGATGCFAVANTVPRPFAGFITISGYGGVLPSAGMELFPENIRQRPIYNVNATGDHLYPIDIVNRFLDFLENSGVRITRKIYTDEKHGFDYREREYPALVAIIKSWRQETFTANTWRFVPKFPNTPADCIGWKLHDNTPNASISTYPSGDTMIVHHQGIKQCIVHLPDQFQNKTIKINSVSRTIPSGKANQQQYNLQFMKYTCFPEPVWGIFVPLK